MARAWSLALPSTPVFLIRSLPARSTKRSLLRLATPDLPRAAPFAGGRSVRWTVTRQCDREDRALRAWPTVCRVSSTVRARRATSEASTRGHRVSPRVSNEQPPPETPRFAAVLAALPGRAGNLLAPASRAASLAARACLFATKHLPQRQPGGWTPWWSAPLLSAAPFPSTTFPIACSAPPPSLRPTRLVVDPTASGLRSSRRS
mmetsp:Transcript_70583/g.159678  ORF Transcript_70583/g.159678 Transcript_70583/m.159678 type:complete len:204 (-) Transcript_70583:594-1205(-)